MYRRIKSLCTIALLMLVCSGYPVVGPAFTVAAQNEASDSESYPKVITIRQAASKKMAGAFILDVRESYEFIQGHIPGSVLIPLPQLESRLKELPSDKEIVVVCQSGSRSRIGLDIIRKADFQKSSSMEGGLNLWLAAGYPVEKGVPPAQ